MFDMPIDQSGLTLARARGWQQSGHSSVEDLVSAGKVDEYGFFIDSEGNKIGGNTWIEGMDTPGGSLSSGDWTTHVAGGPPKDGIPSIDNPKFVSVASSNDLQPREPVIGLEIAGEAKAYPLRILVWHEIVNDTVGGVPVVVTYCPLCNAAIVFDRRVAGRSLTFGTTGKLRSSDLVMYDHATESWWQQFTGEAIVGEYTGRRLQLVPSRLESFELFSKRHPRGSVLVPNDPGFRDYGSNPYVGYDASERPFLFNGELPDGIDPLARVVVLKGGEPRAISLELLRQRRTMTVDGVLLS